MKEHLSRRWWQRCWRARRWQAAAPASVALQSHSGNMLRWAASSRAMAVMRVAAPDGSVSKRNSAPNSCGRGDVGVYPSSKS